MIVGHTKPLGEAISEQQIWRRSKLVAEVRSESVDTVALLQLDTDQPLVLRGTAASVWVLIDGLRSYAEIGAELKENFDDDLALMDSQLADFFTSLESQLLIEAIAVAPDEAPLDGNGS